MAVVDHRLEWDDGAHVMHWRTMPVGTSGIDLGMTFDTSRPRTYKLDQTIRWETGPEQVLLAARDIEECSSLTVAVDSPFGI